MGTCAKFQTGLWHWGGTRTGRGAGEDWDQMVSSYAIACEAVLILLDPLAPVLIDELAADRETTIVLTCPWHARDAPSLAERLGATLYAPPPDQGDPDPVERAGVEGWG